MLMAEKSQPGNVAAHYAQNMQQYLGIVFSNYLIGKRFTVSLRSHIT